MSWDKLSLREKAAYIKIGVQNGLKDIESIKGAYNKFAEGGPEDITTEDKWTVAQNYHTTKDWINNWYSNRTNQLQENINTARKDMIDSGDTLEEAIKTYPYNADELSSNIKNTIDNVKGKFWYGTQNSQNGESMGRYNNGTLYMDIKSTLNNPTIPVHELTHSITDEDVTSPMINKVEDILNETNSRIKGTSNDQYYNRPSEIYPRMNEYRKAAGLKPTDIVNSKNINKDLINKFNLNFGDDNKTVIRLLNEVASNNSYPMGLEIPNYAAYGGNLFFNGGPEDTIQIQRTYTPSSNIQEKISKWEGSSMKTNRSIEQEAKDFNRRLSPYLKERASQEALDAMFSQSYNTGYNRWADEVQPHIEDLYKGKTTTTDLFNTLTVHPEDFNPDMSGFRGRRYKEWDEIGKHPYVEGNRVVNDNNEFGRVFNFEDDGSSWVRNDDGRVYKSEYLTLPEFTITAKKKSLGGNLFQEGG